MATDRQAIAAAFVAHRDRLHGMIDGNPRGAISEADALKAENGLTQDMVDDLAACILVDAGAVAKDPAAVGRGVDILRRLIGDDPSREERLFSAANGLTAQADLTAFNGPDWYLQTDSLRREARMFFRAAAMRSSRGEIRARAFTNLGNALLRGYRYLEAYDAYVQALDVDSSNAIASTGAARILLDFADQGWGDARLMRAAAAKHIQEVRVRPERLRELAGEKAYHALLPLLDLQDTPASKTTYDDRYARFVAQHRLALSTTIEGLPEPMRDWDSLHIASAISKTREIPTIFAMINVLKAEYLNARFLAYTAISNLQPESGSYADTMDKACYGTGPALLTLAQRSSLDILDKIASAATEYFDLGGSPRSVYFRGRWFVDEQGQVWNPKVREEILKGNRALIAVAEICRDVSAGGYLQEKQALRNASTHRFTILHTEGWTSGSSSKFIERYSEDDFALQLIETLQLVRAALFYFVLAIDLREAREAGLSLCLPLEVPVRKPAR